jgi:hypothetical protein
MKITALILLGLFFTGSLIGQGLFYPASNAPDLLYWAFQGGAGGMVGTNETALADSSQHGGTIGWLQQPYNIPWQTNEIGQSNALHFNGVSSILYTTNNASLFNFTTNDFTVYFNIYSYGGHFTGLIGNVDTNHPTAGGWYVDTDYGLDIRLHMENGVDTFVAQNGVTINGWTQIIITRHGTNVAIYSNGLPGPLTTGGGPLTNAAGSSSGLQVANLLVDGSHAVLDGNLYQVGIWGRVLDLYTIQDVYNQQFPNMVANWNLWGNTGDSSWYSNSPAAFAGAPVYTNGPDGVGNHAAWFNGTSQYLTSPLPPAHPSLALGLSFWVKPALIVDDEDLFEWSSDITSPGYAIQTGFNGTNGQIYCALSSDGVDRWSAISSLGLQTNVWTHVAFSWFGLQTNGGYPQIYINGVMDTNETFSGAVPGNNPAYIYDNTSVPFQFGRRYQGGPYGSSFSGAAADIQVYKNGLTPAEVWSNYAGINGHIGAPGGVMGLRVPLDIQISGTNLLLTWPAAAGQTYQLQNESNLAVPAWTPVGGQVTGTGGTLTLTNNFGGLPQRFFRLQLVN